MRFVRGRARVWRGQRAATTRHTRLATLVMLSILPHCTTAEPALVPEVMEKVASPPGARQPKDDGAFHATDSKPGTGGPTQPGLAARTASRRSSSHGKPKTVGVLNLNRATEAELRLLPGIGKARASAIVQRRAKRPFATLEEVGRIRGLKGVVRKLKHRLTLSGDSTLRPADPTVPTRQGTNEEKAPPSG